MKVQLELPDEFVSLLDEVAERVVPKDPPPISQIAWMRTAAGQKVLGELNAGHHGQLDQREAAKLVRRRYEESVGLSSQRGRPRLADKRAQLIIQAVREYVGRLPKERVVSLKAWKGLVNAR